MPDPVSNKSFEINLWASKESLFLTFNSPKSSLVGDVLDDGGRLLGPGKVQQQTQKVIPNCQTTGDKKYVASQNLEN